MSVQRYLLIAVAAVTLAACKSSSNSTVKNDPDPNSGARVTISGIAAQGAALPNQTVKATCKGDSTFIDAVKTDANGKFTGEVYENALPCALSVTTGKPSPQAFHSIALGAGHTNITPLTDLVVALADPTNFPNSIAATSGHLESAVTKLKAQLDANGFDTSLVNKANIFDKAFNTDGSGIDGVIDALMHSFRNASGESKGYVATLNAISEGKAWGIPKNTYNPADPGTGPTDPGDTGPTDPGDTGPTDPGDTDPTDPGDTDPTDPGDTDPTDPGDTDPTDPGNGNGDGNGGDTCTATGLEGNNPLLAAVSPLTDALCPVASKADNFDPQACFTEVASPETLMNAPDFFAGLADPSGGDMDIPVFGDLANNFSACDPSGDPMSCLTALTDTLQNIPSLLMSLPEQFAAGFPGIGAEDDICAPDAGGDAGFNPEDMFAQLASLGGLADAAQEIPVLGDLFGMIADNMPGGPGGGDGGGMPFDPAALAEQLQSGDFSGLTEPAQDALNQIPVLGPIVGQLIEAVSGVVGACAANPGPDCMGDAAEQFAQFASTLEQIPGLGDAISAITSGGIPEFPGGGDTGGGGDAGAGIPGLDQLQSALDQIPVLGPAINQGLGTLIGFIPLDGEMPSMPGGEGGFDFNPEDFANLFTDGLEQLQAIPGLGDFIGLLAGAAAGGGLPDGMPSMPGLPGGEGGGDLPFPTDPAAALEALKQIPGLGMIIENLPSMEGGEMPSSPEDVLAALESIPGLGMLFGAIPTPGAGGGDGSGPDIPGLDELNQIPVLGPILGGIIGGLAGLIPMP